MVTNGAANIDSKIIPGGRNVLTVWGGVNDALVGGQTAATIYANLADYCNTRRAAGWRVVICTEIDAQGALQNAAGWHGTIWPALNALIMADHSFADAVVDLGADARLADATNVTYFNADKVHLIEAGYDVVASLAGPVLATL